MVTRCAQSLAVFWMGAACTMAIAAGQPGDRPQSNPELELLHLLQRPVAEAVFKHERFEDVISWFRAQGVRNVVVEWDLIERDSPAHRDTEIDLQLYGLSLGEVLVWVLRDASQEAVEPGRRLSWQIEGSVLRITTSGALRNELVVRVYDVEDLAQNLMFYRDAPFIAVDGGGRGGSGSGSAGSTGGAGGGEPIIQKGSGDGVDFRENRELGIAGLIATIMAAIEPASWNAGGGRGSIMEFQGRLVVRQTLAIHEQLGGMLSARP